MFSFDERPEKDIVRMMLNRQKLYQKCLIKGYEEKVYWYEVKFDDESVVVMDDEGMHYYVRMDIKSGKAVWRELGRTDNSAEISVVDTAGSLCNAAKALVEVGGAKAVYACATHGVLSGPAYERIENSPIQEIVFLNTIPQVGNTPSGKIKFLDAASVFARAIEHIHGGTSIADLF